VILISQQHNEDRLAGTRSNLMRGGGTPATIEIYDNSGIPERPESTSDAATGVLLATFTLDPDVGTIAANKLVLDPIADALVMADGTARYARWKTGAGQVSMDTDVTDEAGTGEIKLETLEVVAGSLLRIVSAEIG
jgi:hypothetical protein